jgi:hypothetical protein
MPTVRYNLAAALFELGQLNEAEELAVGVRDDAETEEATRELAVELLTRIEAAGGRITIFVEGGDGNYEVYFDDRQIPRARIGVPMAASIGGHVIEARDGTTILARTDAVASHDSPAEARLTLPTPAALSGSENGDGSASGDDGGSLLTDWRFWAAVGGGVVLVAAIVIIAVAAGGGSFEEPLPGDFQPGVLTWD